MDNNSEKRISIDDEILLKKKIGEEIRYSGFNSLEIVGMEKISNEDWKKIKKDHQDWLYQNIIIFKKPVVLALFILSVISIGYFSNHYIKHQKTLIAVSFMVSVLSIGKLGKFEGENEGYYDGFHDGISEGIRRAIKITEEDFNQIRKMSVDMEIDKMMAKGVLERKGMV